MDDNTVQLNTKALDDLIRVFKGEMPVARVGILGQGNARTMQVQNASGKFDTVTSSNAEIGAAHEYGTSKMPQRSFLRMPLMEKLNGEIEKSGGYKDETIKEVIRNRSIKPYMQKIAALAEAIVLDAFNTNGFGKWAPHKPGYTNNTGQILVDTQQLHNSISSEVK